MFEGVEHSFELVLETDLEELGPRVLEAAELLVFSEVTRTRFGVGGSAIDSKNADMKFT